MLAFDPSGWSDCCRVYRITLVHWVCVVFKPLFLRRPHNMQTTLYWAGSLTVLVAGRPLTFGLFILTESLQQQSETIDLIPNSKWCPYFPRHPSIYIAALIVPFWIINSFLGFKAKRLYTNDKLKSRNGLWRHYIYGSRLCCIIY